jgi:glycosyltransferase involved in cell wall biosynthesis
MIRTLHLIDGTFGWEQRITINQLQTRLSDEQCRQVVASVDAGVRPDGIRAFHRTAGMNWSAAPALRKYLAEHPCDVIHAWGPDAAAVACMVVPSSTRISWSVFDPLTALQHRKLLTTLSTERLAAVICASQTVERRFVECGIQKSKCVIIRPGIDFARINNAQSGLLRAQVGIRAGERMIIMPPLQHDDAGEDDIFSAVTMCRYLDDQIRLVIPGKSTRQRQTVDRARRLLFDHFVVDPPDSIPTEELIAVADLLVAAPKRDTSSTAIAWAMAASVPVVATAVYSNAEMLAHKVNCRLVKPAEGRFMALALVPHLAVGDEAAKMADAARGQAFQVFGLRRCMDQHLKLYQNLMTDALPEEGITDSALNTADAAY